MSKLADLCEAEGMCAEQLFEEATHDSIAASICINADCDFTSYMEPDQDSGYCPMCDTNTVKSCLILGGLI